jgi:hypothetical protein
LPVWQKSFLNVMKIWHNYSWSIELVAVLFATLFTLAPCNNPLAALADRETAWR